MVDCRFHIISLLSGSFFRKSCMGRFRIGIGYGRYGIVLCPAPVFAGHMGKEIVGYDFGFVIGFMAEWRPAIDIAQGPDAICAGFEKLIGLDIAAAVETDIRMFQL